MSEKFIRSLVADRAGGATFDQGGSYVFTAMLNAENELEAKAVKGDPSTAILRFSVADPVLKMNDGNFNAGVEFFDDCPDASRYTDLNGIKNFYLGGNQFSNTQECLAFLLNKKYPNMGSNFPMTSDMVQYTYDGIKGPLGTHIPATFFDENTVIIMPNPSYGVIASEVNRMGATVLNIPISESESGYGLDTDSLEDFFLDHREDLKDKKIFLYLNTPHNPTGFVNTADAWEGVLAWARHRDVMIIVDEAYIDLDFTDTASSVMEIPGWSDNAIVLQSVSKAHGATGIRFGWICGDPLAIKAIRNTIDSKNSGLFAPVIMMGLECLADEEDAEKTREKYKKLHSVLSDALRTTGLTSKSSVPEAGLCQLTGFPKKAQIKTDPKKVESVTKHEFNTPTEFANWLRQELLISVMPQDALGKLRWAVTFRPESYYGFNDEVDVLTEVVRRLDQYEFQL